MLILNLQLLSWIETEWIDRLRVAEEMDVTIVKQVDYGIQFEDYSSHKTVLK